MKFTDRTLKNITLTEGKDRQIFTDDGTGLRLRLTKSAKTFTVDYTIAGKRRTRTIGKYPAIGLAVARQLARETIEAAAQGVDVQAEYAVAVSVADAIKEYDRRHLANLAGRQERLTTLNRELAKYLEKPLASVTKVDLRKIIDAKARATTPTTANRLRSYLKAFFRWAVVDDHIDEDPAANLPRPTPEKPRDRVLTVDEMREIYEGAVDWPVVRCLILTAARRSELADLRWSEVNIEGRQIELKGERTKNGNAHVIPLSDAAWNLIEGQGVGKPAEYVFARRVLNRVKSELPELSEQWRLHDFRRAFGTEMSERGVSIEVVELCLGHSIGRLFGTIAATYNRAQHIPQRRIALQSWADIVTDKDSTVVQLHA